MIEQPGLRDVKHQSGTAQDKCGFEQTAEVLITAVVVNPLRGYGHIENSEVYLRTVISHRKQFGNSYRDRRSRSRIF